MPISSDFRCELCQETFAELSKKETAMYTPAVAGEHNTCSACVAKGKKAGLGMHQIMRLTKEAFEQSLARYARQEREAETHEVIRVDFKKRERLPKK